MWGSAAAVALEPEALEAFVIQNLELRENHDQLTLSLKVVGIGDKQLKDTIESGLPWILSFRLELYRHRRLLPNRRLRTWALQHTIRYDNLKEEFHLTRGVTSNESSQAVKPSPTMVKGLEAARDLAARVNDFPIELSRTKNRIRYVLRVRAEVEPIKRTGLPFLDRLFIGFPPIFPWQHETDWFVHEFEF